MKTNMIDIAKSATSLVVGFGTTKIVQTIIKNNVDSDDLNLPQEASVIAASYVLGAVVADASKAKTDETIDEIVLYAYKIKNRLSRKS